MNNKTEAMREKKRTPTGVDPVSLALKASLGDTEREYCGTVCFRGKHDPISPSTHAYYHVIKFQIDRMRNGMGPIHCISP